jgi:hypothetical protein
MWQLALITRRNRFDMVRHCTEAIEAQGGWVLDHQQFANRAICLQFEIARGQAAVLVAVLGLAADAPSGDAEERINGTLHIQFLHDEPDIPVVIPNG